MRVLVLTVLSILCVGLAAPSAATAQDHRLSDAIAIGTTLSVGGSGSERFRGGPEIGGLIELPIGDDYRLRAETATGFWHFNGDPLEQVAGGALRRHRITASVVRAPRPPSPAHRFSAYGGGGAGVHLFRFPGRGGGGGWGIHGVVGGEYLLRTLRSRWLVGAEAQLHVAGQPRQRGQVRDVPLLSAHIAAVVKYRLP